jgi:hypothetical protein
MTSSFMIERSHILDKIIPNVIKVPNENKTSNDTVSSSTTATKHIYKDSSSVQNTSYTQYSPKKWKGISTSNTEQSIITTATTPTQIQELDEKLTQQIGKLEDKFHTMMTQVKNAATEQFNAKVTQLESVVNNVVHRLTKQEQAQKSLKSAVKNEIAQMQDTLQTEMRNQIKLGFQENRKDMHDLNQKFAFLCEQLKVNGKDATTKDVDGNESTISKVNDNGTTVAASSANDVEIDLVDTPTTSAIRKPTYATPINRWHQPKRVAKGRPTVVKKLNDNSDKVTKQLNNFFQPLAENNDDSEHPMTDAIEQA